MSAALMGVVSVAIGRLRGEDRIIGAWGQAMLLLAAGLLGLALRGAIPDWISIAVANTAVIASLVLAMRGLRRFLGSKPRDALGWTLTGALFLVLLYFSEWRPNTDARTTAISAALVAIAVRAALLVRSQSPVECRNSARFTEAIFWGVAVMTTARVVGVMLSETMDPMAPDLLNSATFLFYAGFIIASTLGVMWMEIETLQAGLVRAARLDALTGLQNRGTFLEAFAREEARAARGGPAFSLAIFDLDRFKQVNDRYGHPAGDRVLQAFADVLRATVRPYDVVGRYGGEEFALLMPQTGKETAARVAERVRHGLEARGADVGGRRIDVTVSAGVATYGLDGADWDTLLTAADNALYEAKSAGRNRVVAAGAAQSPR
jgi:diguanylate cyclase (GGDEF)-like protein